MRPLLICCVGFWLLPLSAFSQSPYSIPLSKIIKNEDGTRLTRQVDPDNQRVEEVLKDASNKTIWRLVMELDDELQPMKGVKFDGQDQVVSRHNYICLKGRLEEEEVMDSKGKLLAKMVYFYDSKGRMNRIDHLNAAGALISSSKATGAGVEPLRRDSNGKPQK